MAGFSSPRGGPQKHNIRYKLVIVEALIFVLPLLCITYIIYQGDYYLDPSHLILFSLIILLILGGLITLRQIFERIATIATSVKKAEQGDMIAVDIREDVSELHDISLSLNNLVQKFEETTKELTRRTFELFMIKELTENAKKKLSINELMDVILEKCMAVTGAQIGSVFMVEVDPRHKSLVLKSPANASPLTEKPAFYRFRVVASKGHKKELERDSYISIDKSLAKHVFLEKKILLVQDIEKDQRTLKANDPQYGPPSFLSMPIFIGRRLAAVVNLAHKETGQLFDGNDEQVLTIMLGEISFALENAMLHSEIDKELQKSKTHTIKLEQEIEERKRVEAALRENEKKYKGLFNFLPISLFEISKEGYVITSNPMSAKTFGYTQEEVNRGLNALRMFVPEDLERVQADIQRVLNGEQIGGIEYTMIRKDGSTFPVIIFASPIIYGSIPVGLRGAIIDLTERKQSEEHQRLVNRILETLNTPNEMTNLIHKILLLVKEHIGIEAIGIRLREGEDFPYYETTGFPPHFVEAENYLCARDHKNELIRDSQGNPYLECMCGNIICGRTDSSLPFFTEGGSFWTNRTTELLASTFEKDRQARMRNRCNSAGYESVALIPLRSGEEIIGLLQLNDKRPDCFTLEMIQYFEGIGASIGIAIRRMRSEDTLKESEAKYRSLAASIDSMYLVDRDCTYLFVNEGHRIRFDLPVEEIIGRKYENFHSEEDAQEFAECVREVCKTGKPIIREHRSERDGRYFLRTFSPAMDRGAAEEISKVVIVSKDITDLKQLERDLQNARDQLFHSEKLAAMGRLSTGVAHEILNPVNIISMELQLLQTMENLPPEATEELAICRDQLNRIVTIAENLTQFARVPTKPMVKCDINILIDRVLNIYSSQLKIKRVATVVQYQSDLPAPFIDTEKMEQVIFNLVTNAIDFMEGKEKKVLQITTGKGSPDKTHDYIKITVADTGTGIRTEDMPKIFEPFFTTREPGKGTGLGLYISYGIIQDHGGRIRAENNEEGGATFFIELPVIRDTDHRIAQDKGVR